MSDVGLPRTPERTIVARNQPEAGEIALNGSAAPAQTGAPTIPALTSLRFFAAFAIVLFHAWALHWLSPGFFGQACPWHAVSFFFILSGFILQYNYRDVVDVLGPARLIGLRIARIWPLHVAAILCVALLLPVDFEWAFHNLSPRMFVSALVLLQSWDPHPLSYFAINSPAWSLSDELFFYACFPWLCVAARRFPATLVGATLSGLALYLFAASLIPESHRVMPGLYAVFPIVRLPEFVLGMVLCEVGRGIACFRGKTLLWTGLEAAALTFAATLNMFVLTVHAWLVGHGWEGLAAYYAEAGTVPAFLLLILVFSMNSGLLSRLLSVSALVYLGEISFAVYMLHQPIERFVDGRHLIANPALRTAVVAITVIASAAVAFHLIERPINRFARRTLAPARGGNRVPAAAPSTPVTAP